MESTSSLTTHDISNLDKILSLIVDKGKINKSMVAKHLSLDRLETDFIFNTFCTYADNLDIIKAQFFNNGSAAIVRVHKPQLTRFIDSGGFNEYFKEKEVKNVSTIHNETIYGDKIQDSSLRDFKPYKKNINENPISKPETKSLVKKIFSSPWTIAFTILLIEELTLSKIYKYIIVLF